MWPHVNCLFLNSLLRSGFLGCYHLTSQKMTEEETSAWIVWNTSSVKVNRRSPVLVHIFSILVITDLPSHFAEWSNIHFRNADVTKLYLELNIAQALGDKRDEANILDFHCKILQELEDIKNSAELRKSVQVFQVTMVVVFSKEKPVHCGNCKARLETSCFRC